MQTKPPSDEAKKKALRDFGSVIWEGGDEEVLRDALESSASTGYLPAIKVLYEKKLEDLINRRKEVVSEQKKERESTTAIEILCDERVMMADVTIDQEIEVVEEELACLREKLARIWDDLSLNSFFYYGPRSHYYFKKTIPIRDFEYYKSKLGRIKKPLTPGELEKRLESICHQIEYKKNLFKNVLQSLDGAYEKAKANEVRVFIYGVLKKMRPSIFTEALNVLGDRLEFIRDQSEKLLAPLPKKTEEWEKTLYILTTELNRFDSCCNHFFKETMVPFVHECCAEHTLGTLPSSSFVSGKTQSN